MSTALLMLIIMVIPNITLIIVNGCSFHCNHLAFMHQSCDTISFIFESIKTIKSLNIANIASTRGPWYKSFIENTQELTKMTTTFTNTLENICKLYEVHETYARNLKKNFVDASTNEFLIMKHLDWLKNLFDWYVENWITSQWNFLFDPLNSGYQPSTKIHLNYTKFYAAYDNYYGKHRTTLRWITSELGTLWDTVWDTEDGITWHINNLKVSDVSDTTSETAPETAETTPEVKTESKPTKGVENTTNSELVSSTQKVLLGCGLLLLSTSLIFCLPNFK